MGFLVLLAIGGILGWLASIMTHSDDSRSIALNVVIAMAAAIAIGVATSPVSLLFGLTVTALLLSVAGAAVSVGGFNLARDRFAR